VYSSAGDRVLIAGIFLWSRLIGFRIGLITAVAIIGEPGLNHLKRLLFGIPPQVWPTPADRW
jgi:hypothetical protein